MCWITDIFGFDTLVNNIIKENIIGEATYW
jgi:hypothetical protein